MNTSTPFSLEILIKTFSIISLLFFGSSSLQAQLAAWDFEGEVNTASIIATDVVAYPAAFGSGLGTASFPEGNGSIDSYSANGWTIGATADGDDFFQVSLSAEDCNILQIRGFNFDERRSATGVGSFRVDVDFTLADGTTGSSGVMTGVIPDNIDFRSQSAVFTLDCTQATFKIFGFNAEAGTGTWRFDNVEVLGTVAENDTEAPEVTCAEFTETFTTCTDVFPNTPNGNWNPVPSGGTFLTAVGGSFIQTVDLNGCVTDNCSAVGDMEWTLISSYEENRVPGCSVNIFNEIGIRDASGNVSLTSIITRSTLQFDGPAPVISCPADAETVCGATDPADTGMATATSGCGDPVITFVDGPETGSCGVTLETTFIRTWTATDGCGQTSTCEQVITVADPSIPTMSQWALLILGMILTSLALVKIRKTATSVS